MERLAFILYSPQAEIRKLVSKGLDDTGLVDVVGDFRSIDDFEEALRIRRLDGVYVDVGTDPSAVLDVLEDLREPRPMILLGGPMQDSEVLLRGVRLGIQEFFVDHQLSDRIVPLLERIRSHSLPGSGQPASCRVLTVIGAKGGVGTTLVACELAANLQRLGERVGVIDLNLHLGDVAMHFDLTPDFSLVDMAKKGAGLDVTFIRTIGASHSTGVSVIASPPHLEDVGMIAPADVERVIEMMRSEFTRLVLDISRPWSDVSVRAISNSDQILIVTTLDVPSLSHTRQHLELLERLGFPEEQIRLVVNRHDSQDALGRREVKEFLGRPPDALIPNDEIVAQRSVNQGKLVREVARDSKVDQAFMSLADRSYEWFELESPRKKGRGLAGRLRGLVLRR
jgi:pilus assembly protein CpaE